MNKRKLTGERLKESQSEEGADRGIRSRKGKISASPGEESKAPGGGRETGKGEKGTNPI